MPARIFNLFQKEHFVEAEHQRFNWQTANPVILRYETEVLTELALILSETTKVLEVGCGEGANLINLPENLKAKLVVGSDFSAQKAEFWYHTTKQIQVAEAIAGLCADATCLPVSSASFDIVFCQDLLHHLTLGLQPQVVAEMFRVYRSGGRVVFIESNERIPIIFPMPC